MQTLTIELAEVMAQTFTTYRNVSIEKTLTGYKVLNTEVSTMLEAKAKIDEAWKNFSNL